MNIIDLSYPIWSLALIFAIAVAIAGILYFKNIFEQNKPLTMLLYAMRTLGVFLLLFLLLNPFFSRSQNEEQKARIIYLQDDTRSLFFDQDSLAEESYRIEMHNFLKGLEENHPIDAYAFGQDASPLHSEDINFDQGVTDISKALKYTDELHRADHIGAMIITTDGIYNRGTNPAYFRNRGNYPVYVLALGDTTPIQDIRIQQVLYNEIVRKNETSQIQADVTGQYSQTGPIRVTLQSFQENGWINLETQSIQPTGSGEFFKTITFEKKYKNPGIERMRIILRGIENDKQLENNIREFFVEVLETARKIHIVSAIPHPDIGALNTILAENDNNEVTVSMVERPTDLPDMNDFNVLIFYQLPNVPFLINFAKQAITNKKGVILTAGINTTYSAFNELQDLVSVIPKTNTDNLFNVRINPGFDLFVVDESLNNYVSSYPPLTGVFGDYTITGQGQALLYQKIGELDTDFPVVFTGIQDGNRMGIVTLEGFWKWKLFEYLEKQETPVLNELFDKIVEYVSQEKDDRLFRLQKNKLLFDETEDIIFQAELYNESLERINGPDVFFELRDSAGNRSEFTFDKTTIGYHLNLGHLTPGSYTYRAYTTTGGETYEENGQFSVRHIDLEAYNLEANHQDLNILALQNKGKVFYRFSDLEQELNNLPAMKPLLIQSHLKTAMIDWKWIFGIILFIFSAEWLLRRYYGSY